MSKRYSRLFPFIAALALAIPARAEWHVEDAPLRFTYHLSQQPTHDRAGYFVHIPDGGILPGPFPVTHVFTTTGTEIKSYTLWQNQGAGMAVILEAPASGDRVLIYVTGESRLTTWTPSTGLTPSAILCANPDRGDVKAASRLARMGRVGPRVHYRQNPVHPKAPLCIQGDLSGRPSPCSFYLLAHVVVSKPGRTWIAPMTVKGKSEVRVNGKRISLRKRINKWGGTGDYMNLSTGLHRVEILSASKGRGTFAEGQGVIWMTWAPAGSSVEDLGGPRPDDVPYAGTSKQASRVLRRDEVVRSGHCSLQEVRSRDDTPIALVQLRPIHNYWFEGESPLLLYELSALTAGNPEDTAYTWNFSGKRTHTGVSTPWLFPGAQENTVALTAMAGEKQTQSTRSFFSHSTVQTDLDNPSARTIFGDACLNMVLATPSGVNPVQGWGTSLWNNLFRTMGLGEGKALLAALFKQHWDVLKRSAPPDRLAALQDRFITIAPTIDPKTALEWITRFEQATAGSRKAVLQIKRAEILMYYLDNMDEARRILRVHTRSQGEVREWAKIRLGDAELLAGNLNEATALYGDVQNRYRTMQKTSRIKDWKMQAILDVSASETVRAFLDQSAYDEAFDVLTQWERQFPLSKISGDLAVLESKLYMALGHHRRARQLLEAYCREVDVSSFLPEALGDLLECMLELKESKDTIRTFCEDARKRLKFHPEARRFEQRF